MRIIQYGFGVMMIMLAIFAAILSRDFVNMGGGDIGPAAFPVGVSVLTIFLSLLLIYSSWKDPALVSRVREVFTAYGLSRVGKTILLLILYFILMAYLGFLVSTALFLIGFLWQTGVRKWATILLVSLGTTGVLYYVFYFLFNVQFPTGTL